MKSIKNATASVVSGVANVVCTTGFLVFEAGVYVEKKINSKLTDKTESEISKHRCNKTLANVEAVNKKIDDLKSKMKFKSKERQLEKYGMA